jgi:hypothetical protein
VSSPQYLERLWGCSMDTGYFILGSKGPELAADHSLHLLLKLRMSGAIPPLLRMPSWRVHTQLYLFQYVLFVKAKFYFEISAMTCADILNSLRGHFVALFVRHPVSAAARTYRVICVMTPCSRCPLYGDLALSTSPFHPEHCNGALHRNIRTYVPNIAASQP